MSQGTSLGGAHSRAGQVPGCQLGSQGVLLLATHMALSKALNALQFQFPHL